MNAERSEIMLERTFELIADLPAGTYVSPEEKRYDDAEIDELARVLNRLLYAPSQIRGRLQDLGVNVVPANFYSEVPSIVDVENPTSHSAAFTEVFDPALLASWLDKLDPFAEEFTPAQDPQAPGEFGWNNSQFSYSDAVAYYCFIRQVKPARVLEIGSGWSSLVALMALRKNGSGRLTCVDPYPAAVLESVRSEIELIPSKAQDLDRDFLSNRLGDGDILFIDSTHTVKHDSDCIHIYLRMLPAIAANVYVHAHDIRLPNPLSIEMMRDSQIYWTEQYLLYAYLLGNERCEVLFSSTYLLELQPEKLTRFMRGRAPAGGGSLWFSQDAVMKPTALQRPKDYAANRSAP